MTLLHWASEAIKRRAATVAALHVLFPSLDRYGIPEGSDPAYLKRKLAETRQELADTRRLASETQARYRHANEMAQSFMVCGTLETWKTLQEERDILRSSVAELEAELSKMMEGSAMAEPMHKPRRPVACRAHAPSVIPGCGACFP